MEKFVRYFILGMFCSCSVQAEGPPYDKYVSEIIHSFAQDMKREYGLVCIVSGGQMPRNVETIKMIFNSYDRANVEQARDMMVNVKKKLVEKVNAHEKIRPYLKQYPFTWREADISIAFHKPNSSSYYLDGSVAMACSADRGAKISYDAAELQTRNLSGLIDEQGNVLIPSETVEREVFVDLFSETYEEALVIVNASKKNEKSR